MSEYSVGSLVQFRGREWVVMPSDDRDVLQLRPLTGSDRDTCGVYRPLEGHNLQATTFPLPTVRDIGDFESAKLLRDASRLLLRNGAAPLRCFGHLSFRPRPYQLVPLLMALRLNPVRMLIADDVGIGKTIEAALIARELLDRGEVKRLAVVCPPYLCDQWQRELADKFNINANIIRTNTLARLERALPRQNMSVFEYYPHIVVSIDFVKSHRRKDAFLLHAPELVIVDEAHGAARPAGQSVAQQQRHELIHDLAANGSRHLLLVTATPHSGIEESFFSLLGFIKPAFQQYDLDKIDQNRRAELAQHFIQRQRADVVNWADTQTAFPKRDSLEVSFALSREYRKFFNDIYKFARQLVVSEATQTAARQRVRYWAALALLRCVMSSPAAAKAALLARIERLSERHGEEELDYSNDVYDPTDVESVADIVPSHIIDEGEATLAESERRKLREFTKRADQLKGDSDTKMAKAEELVRGLLKDGFKPIVFCRFIATADYVAKELQERLQDEFKELHVLAVTGSYSEDEREIRITELSGAKHRVLVATDCLSEGINLQEHFNAAVHYDLPWNPNRLEQREGRVDRFGQTSKKVKAIILYGSDNPVDGAVLNVLLRKAKKIHKQLGITVPIPVDSESVMETVLRALFLRSNSAAQLGLFEDEAPVIEVHRKWDRAADREKKSRTLFAQHRIKPETVVEEMNATESILGNPETVRRFVQTACQRINSPIQQHNEYWKIDMTNMPPTVKAKLTEKAIAKITFDQPREAGIIQVTRNQPLTSALAEYLFDTALNPDGDRNIAARCGVIRSKEVDSMTTLLLLRLRYALKTRDTKSLSIAEECLLTGFQGEIGAVNWLTTEEAESLFDIVTPSANLTDREKEHWVGNLFRDFNQLTIPIRDLAHERAGTILRSHERVRKTAKLARVIVEPLLPADILALVIILPLPKI